jgi:hypothetical protein
MIHEKPPFGGTHISQKSAEPANTANSDTRPNLPLFASSVNEKNAFRASGKAALGFGGVSGRARTARVRTEGHSPSEVI